LFAIAVRNIDVSLVIRSQPSHLQIGTKTALARRVESGTGTKPSSRQRNIRDIPLGLRVLAFQQPTKPCRVPRLIELSYPKNRRTSTAFHRVSRPTEAKKNIPKGTDNKTRIGSNGLTLLAN
jgi:hypothetical protein